MYEQEGGCRDLAHRDLGIQGQSAVPFMAVQPFTTFGGDFFPHRAMAGQAATTTGTPEFLAVKFETDSTTKRGLCREPDPFGILSDDFGAVTVAANDELVADRTGAANVDPGRCHLARVASATCAAIHG